MTKRLLSLSSLWTFTWTSTLMFLSSWLWIKTAMHDGAGDIYVKCSRESSKVVNCRFDSEWQLGVGAGKKYKSVIITEYDTDIEARYHRLYLVNKKGEKFESLTTDYTYSDEVRQLHYDLQKFIDSDEWTFYRTIYFEDTQGKVFFVVRLVVLACIFLHALVSLCNHIWSVRDT
ncbi:MAG: hypothetical protein RMK91_05895 [Pseudanabaenaceae cyanobacterium SKYGB_i_bin29]|nr:hypothetical protein [Pseudanabaenaceae cyanobacterium SKYG29]MDW8421383.1 hypothetical protein [Pseudanabaenaceae cyanobacterium SKYGB_i_bin29]